MASRVLLEQSFEFYILKNILDNIFVLFHYKNYSFHRKYYVMMTMSHIQNVFWDHGQVDTNSTLLANISPPALEYTYANTSNGWMEAVQGANLIHVASLPYFLLQTKILEWWEFVVN